MMSEPEIQTDKLPDRLSDLIELALDDLAWVIERPDQYEIKMSVWHRKSKISGLCQVCLAGSVLARTLGVRADYEESFFDNLSTRTQDKLHALNEVRMGNVGVALSRMTQGASSSLIGAIQLKAIRSESTPFVEYNTDPTEWHAWMNSAVDLLRAHDL